MENPLTDSQPGGPLDPAQFTLIQPNEPNPTAATENKDSTVQKILGRAANAYDAVVSTIKPGRGRPRKDGSPKISDKVGTAPAAVQSVVDNKINPDNRAVASPPLVESLDAEIITAGIEVIRDNTLGFFKHRQTRKAVKLGLSKIEADDILNQLDLTPKEQNSCEKLTAILVKKYGVNIQYLPEVVALILIVGVTGRCLMVNSDLNDRLDEKAKQDKKNAAQPSLL